MSDTAATKSESDALSVKVMLVFKRARHLCKHQSGLIVDDKTTVAMQMLQSYLKVRLTLGE